MIPDSNKLSIFGEELMVVTEITLIKEGDEFYLEEMGPFRERRSVSFESKEDAIRAFKLNTLIWEE